MEIDNLIRALQASIAPCVLISGIGLLLLCMTNRLGRASDRIWILAKEIKSMPADETVSYRNQIPILYKRCLLLRLSIALAAFSIFLVANVILLLFSTYVLSLSLTNLIKFLFAVCLISLVISLVLFMFDIGLTLKALRIEIKPYLEE